jgi:cytochrome c5
LAFVKERSITVRAHDIKVPDLSKPDMIKSGAKNFDAMCALCHLSPIKESTELSLGLYPKAPVFYQQNHTGHGAGNTFWIIKNQDTQFLSKVALPSFVLFSSFACASPLSKQAVKNNALNKIITVFMCGAKNFDAMCAQCHLSPIKESTELSLGLYPKAPVFYQQNHTGHGAGNTFWTIKNGLKMTGMPAWGDSHTDQQIWEMVAFLEKLNDMSAAKYTQLVGDGGHTHKNIKHIEEAVVPKSNNAHQENGHLH